MRRLVLALVFLALAALVVVGGGSSDSKRVLNKEYNDCIKNCTRVKAADFDQCKAVYRNYSDSCSLAYKLCSKNINKSMNRSIVHNLRKNCTDAFTRCKVPANNMREGCIRNSTRDFRVCKDNCQSKKLLCLEVYMPVCGVDNKTYSNQCFLDIAGIKKQYDGPCNASRQCVKDSQCRPYFSSCSCSWVCVAKIPDVDCARACLDVYAAKPDCDCILGKCVPEPVCGDGVCEEGENSSCHKDCRLSCTDSDGGRDIFERGTAAFGAESLTDSCTGCNLTCLDSGNCPPVVCSSVVEHYCTGKKLVSETVVCPQGSACRDGACTRKPECRSDRDCPQLVCVRYPCPSYHCIEGKCRISSCSKGECEP
jgi:hypothetical protein